nr:hypothetical protein [Candidatus Delongbacteria bacterium]
QLVRSYDKATTRIHTVNLTATWNMTPRWTINYNTTIDLIAREVLSHNMVLKSDLHCWEFMFRYQETPHYRQLYWIINIKDIPDIKIEQHRRTY